MRPAAPASLALLSTLCVLSLAGCPDAPPTGDGGLPTSSTALIWEPTTGPIDFGAMPFPDDLFLQDGHVVLGALPAEALAFSDYAATARLAFQDLDGFGATTPIFFPTDGDVDASSLPVGGPESLLDSSSVFLIDVDSRSPDLSRRVPVTVRFDAQRDLIAVRPWNGHPLYEGRRYAAVVTTSVLGVDGMPITPSARFASVRDATARPTDALLADAWDELNSVIVMLGTGGIAPSEIAGIAVFTVQSVEAGLEDARALLHAGAPGAMTIDRVVASGAEMDALLGTPAMDVPGTDVDGGVQHSHIGWVIDGHFEAPNFLSETPMVHGRFSYDASGALIVRRMDTVPFTVALPAGDVTDLRVVVFQHGLGSERSALFSIADAMCAAGWAVAAIDIPFHGMRAAIDTTLIDSMHRYGTTPGSDLYGELGGSTVYLGFVGAGDTAGELSAFHPFYVRDVLRQSVSDLMELVHQLDDGDWSVVAAAGGPAGLAFSAMPIGFVGVSLGGIVGTTFVTTEPRVGAGALNVTGGVLTALVGASASFNGAFLPVLSPRIGLDPATIDYATLPPEMLPELAIYQTLLDAGDSMAYAPLLALRERHLLFQMALDDETVPNSATESLARASGAVIAAAEPRFSDLERSALPVMANVSVGSASFTRALTVFSPATHGLLSRRADTHDYVHPVVHPFDHLPSPEPVANPVDAAVGQLVHFFSTWQAGAAEIAAPL